MNLLTSGKLNNYLADIDNQAEEMFSRLVKQLAEKENVTEKLKAENQMTWVQKMSNSRNRATEIVNTEMVFALEIENTALRKFLCTALRKFLCKRESKQIRK